MSVLQKTKRRFLLIWVITCVLLLTFSWHLLWQTHDPIIIKRTNGNGVNVESDLSRRLKESDSTTTDLSSKADGRSNNQSEINIMRFLQSNFSRNEQKINKSSADRKPSHDALFADVVNSKLLKDVQGILNRAHNLIDKVQAGHSLSGKDLSFIHTLKKQMKSKATIENKTKDIEALEVSVNSSENKDWKKYKYLSRTINTTLSMTDSLIKNMSSDASSVFHSGQIDKQSLTNHIKSGFQQQNPTQRPLFSKGNHVRRFSDVNLEDLQETWDKMKVNRPSLSDHVGTNQDHMEFVGAETDRPDYCSSCFSYKFPILINQPQLCKTNEPVHLLIFIASAPGKREARVVLRKTWAAKCRKGNSEQKCLFVVGRSKDPTENQNIITENKTYGDILQIDFKDSYGNLTYKTVTSLHWAAKFCASAKYVMKTDDDMFVNTDLIPLMLHAAPSRDFVGGNCWGSSRPNRDLSSKWFVSFKMYRKQKFPPMCSGTGYILSMDVVQKILIASHNIPFFHLEDVYVSMCMQKYGIMPNNILGFSNMYTEFEACRYKNSVMTSHEVPSKMLEDFWPVIQACPTKFVSPKDLYIVIPYPITD